jgi:hypothetical protein
MSWGFKQLKYIYTQIFGLCLKSIVMKINNLIKEQNLLQLEGQINQKLRYTSITHTVIKLIL